MFLIQSLDLYIHVIYIHVYNFIYIHVYIPLIWNMYTCMSCQIHFLYKYIFMFFPNKLKHEFKHIIRHLVRSCLLRFYHKWFLSVCELFFYFNLWITSQIFCFCLTCLIYIVHVSKWSGISSIVVITVPCNNLLCVFILNYNVGPKLYIVAFWPKKIA